MDATEVLTRLESVGTAQTRKILARHGVSGETYGASYGEMNKLKKKIKVDHELAEELWAAGVFEARVVATMIADPDRLRVKDLEEWVRELDSYPITDAFAGLVARSSLARKRVEKWTKARSEFISAAGWQLLSHLALSDDSLTDAELEGYLESIEHGIGNAKNRTKHSMNGALISIGLRNSALEKKAIAVAKRIGKVEVDHGQTSCKTPDAVAYIRKGAARRKSASR